MHKDTKLALLNANEDRHVSIMVSRGLLKLKPGETEYKFKNTVLTGKAIVELKRSKLSVVEVDAQLIEDFRAFFPEGFRSTRSLLKQKLGKYKAKYPDVTDDMLLRAAEIHNQRHPPPYCGKAGNFISKKEPGQAEESRLHAIIEEIQDRNNEEQTFENRI